SANRPYLTKEDLINSHVRSTLSVFVSPKNRTTVMKGINFTLAILCWLLIITVRCQIPGWSLSNLPDSPNAAWSSSQVGGRGHADRVTSILLGAISRGQVQQQQQHQQQPHQQFWTEQTGTQDTFSIVGGSPLDFGNTPQQGQPVVGSVHIRDQQSRASQQALPQDQFIIHAPSVISLQSLAPDWNLDWWYQPGSNIAPSLDQRLPELTQQTSSSQHRIDPNAPVLQGSVGQPSQQQSAWDPATTQQAIVSHFQPSQSRIIAHSPQQPPSQPVPPQPPSQPVPPQPPSQPVPPQVPSQPVSPQLSSQPVPPPIPPPPPSNYVPAPFHAQTAMHTSDLSQHVPPSPVVQQLQTSHIQPHQPLVPVPSVQQQQTWGQPRTWSEHSPQQPQTWTHPVVPQAAVSWTEEPPVQEPLSPAWEVGTQHLSPPIPPQPLPALPVNPPSQANMGPPPLPPQSLPALPANPPSQANVGPPPLPPQTLSALPVNTPSQANMGHPPLPPQSLPALPVNPPLPPSPSRMLTQTSHVVLDNQQKIPANYVLLGHPDSGNRTSFPLNSLPPTGGEIPPFPGQYQQLNSETIPSPSAIPLVQHTSEAIPPPAKISLTRFASESVPPPAAVPLLQLSPEVIPPPAAVKQDVILQAETTAQSVTEKEITRDNSQLPAGTRMPPVNLGQPSNSQSQINFLYTTPSQVGFLPSTNIFPQSSWDAAWEHYYHDPAQFSNSGSSNQGNAWGQQASQTVQNQLISQSQHQHHPSALTQPQSPSQQSQLVQEQSFSQQPSGQQGTSSSQWNPQPPALTQQLTESTNQWASPSDPQLAPQQTSWQQTSQQLLQQSSWQTQPQPPPQPMQQQAQAQWQHQPVQPQPAQQQSVWQHGQPQQPQEQHGQQHGVQQQLHWQQPQPAQPEPQADIGTVHGQGWAAVISSRPAQLQYGVTLVDGTSYTEEYSLPMSRVQQIVVKDPFDRVVTSLTVDRNSGTFSLRSKRGINLCYVGMIDQDVLDNMNGVSDSIRTSTHPYIHQINELFVYREAEQLFPRDVRAVAGDFLARTCGHEPIIFRIVKAQNSVIVNGNLTLPGETCPFGPPLRSGFNLYSCGSAGYCPLLYTCNIQYGLCCPESKLIHAHNAVDLLHRSLYFS
ncbi:hypothetical protein CHS0354_001326, partial [Potamilus streckersoni]